MIIHQQIDLTQKSQFAITVFKALVLAIDFVFDYSIKHISVLLKSVSL